jgi:hypothetical protein
MTEDVQTKLIAERLLSRFPDIDLNDDDHELAPRIVRHLANMGIDAAMLSVHKVIAEARRQQATSRKGAA